MRTIKLIIIAAFIFEFNLQASCEQIPDSCLTDVLNYSFQIKISDNTDSIFGEATIKLIALSSFHSFGFDLENRKADGKGMTVFKVLHNGSLVKFWQNTNKLIIENGQEILKGNISEYKIQYKGIPSDGIIISKNRFGSRTFFADNWPERARYWIPCNDFQSDKATVQFSIIAPSHYQVVSNGKITGRTIVTPEMTQWNWSEEIPISTKVMVFGAADFAISSDSSSSGIPVQSWVYRDNKNEGFKDYAPAKEIVEIFQSIIGKYPYEKLANIQSTTIYGGMENASCIFYAENSVTGHGNDEELLAHEIAHQWFGNSVTECDWTHLWLSEGFATFFANIYFEKKYGTKAYHSRLVKEREEAINWPGSLSLSIIPLTSKNPRSQLNPVTYQKAGWVLHMLRTMIGDSCFFKGIRNYYSQYANSTACTDDFKKIMEEASGKELNDFFEDWLISPGYPEIQVKWHFNSEQKLIQFTIDQNQKKIFKTSLEILIKDSNKLFKIPLTSKSTEISFRLDSVPDKIIIDPETKVFGKFTQSKF